jgi:hypothetical protein
MIGNSNHVIYIDCIAIFTGWNITGTANLSYLFKKVNNTSKWTFGSDWVGYKGWNHPGFYRSYWAMNPMEGIKATSEETQGTPWKLQYCTYADITTSVLATADKTKALYCMENAADNFEDGLACGGAIALQGALQLLHA